MKCQPKLPNSLIYCADIYAWCLQNFCCKNIFHFKIFVDLFIGGLPVVGLVERKYCPFVTQELIQDDEEIRFCLTTQELRTASGIGYLGKKFVKARS